MICLTDWHQLDIGLSNIGIMLVKMIIPDSIKNCIDIGAMSAMSNRCCTDRADIEMLPADLECYLGFKAKFIGQLGDKSQRLESLLKHPDDVM